MVNGETWFLMELHTGAIEGSWQEKESAERSVDLMEDLYKGSRWVVCSMSSGQRDKAGGSFPNRLIAHESFFEKRSFAERVSW